MLKRIFRLCFLFSLVGLFAACEKGEEPDVPVSSVSVSQPSAELIIGQTLQLSATVSPYDATNKEVVWASANPSVATVSNGGLVTAVAEGSTDITASAGGKKASCKVTVRKGVVDVSSVELSQTTLTLVAGESATLTATVKPDDATDKTVTWSSSNTAIATVENGVVTAISEGAATITAKAGDKTATCAVTVEKKVIPVESVSLDRTSLELISGESEQLTATVSPDDATDKTVTWSSSNTSVVDVDQKGQVRANHGGTATITARAGDKSATCQVTVTVPVDKISLDQTSVTLTVGENVTLTATVKPDDATDKTVSWNSSDTSVADVDQKGQVRANNAGTATITARAGEKTATCRVTVVNPDTPDNPDDPDDPDDPDRATGVVVTQYATSVSAAEATLNASFSGVTGAVAEAGFYWGSSPNSLLGIAYANPPSGKSGTFSTVLNELAPGTTYYYKAFIVEYDAYLGQYVDRTGSILSFTTQSPSPSTGIGYLNCFEMPAVSSLLNGNEVSGFLSDRDDHWFRYYTNNSQRQIASHTYTLNGKQVRNYTVMYDGSRYAPVWTAHAMHKSMWPDNGVKRNDAWDTDPAIKLPQQTGLDNANSIGFSRGHLVASNYRQSSKAQNKQTFYYTNQAPQWQNSFNDGVWSSLEGAVVSNAPSGRDTLYVITGVLYEGSIQTKPSGSLQVPIPSHFYKCLMLCSFNASGEMISAKGCAYVFTNEAHPKMDYSQGRTTIDAIESRAGFDFFANVPKALQDAAEKTSNSIW